MSLVVNPFIDIPASQAIISPRLLSSLFSSLLREGGAVEVYGERGMGKTTILNYIANPPREWHENFQNHIFVFLNCQDQIHPVTANQFWAQIIKQLARKSSTKLIKSKCDALLERPNEELKLSHHDFHDVLDIAGEENKKIALVLDDFNVLIQTDSENLNNTRAFLQGLRSLTTRDANKANLLVATRRSLNDSCKPLSLPNYSAFNNGFYFCRLTVFQDQELLNFLARAEKAGQPSFNSTERKYVADLSGCHPKLAQIAASKLFERRIDMGVPLNDLSSVGEQFKNEASSIFETLFQGASEGEQLLLMLIALQSLKGKVANGNYDISDLPQIFSEKEREINDLTERGLLKRTQANPPVWELFSPIFQWWILKEIESEDSQQLEERRKVWLNLLTPKRVAQIGNLVEFIKKNWDTIEPVGRSIISMTTGLDIPKLPGS